jgi:hypothetical protein
MNETVRMIFEKLGITITEEKLAAMVMEADMEVSKFVRAMAVFALHHSRLNLEQREAVERFLAEQKRWQSQ